MNAKHYPLLHGIQSSTDLKSLREEQLPELAQEIRRYLIETLDQCGGHFGANLGSVEITIALHYLLKTPEDNIIWDVGHQAYPHKILTGRAHLLNTIKQHQGLAPFPSRDESPYDSFSVGHSSTSISAATGMSLADWLNDKHRTTVAVIGDGGLTGGIAFEALNHAGSLDCNLTIILNDNEMSISENVGAMTQYFARMLSAKSYQSFRETSKKILANIPPLSRLVKRTETHLKGMIQPGTIFEELGFHYIGPVDGHDITACLRALRNTQKISGPKFIHLITKKGKGYDAAEKAPIKYHAVTPGFHSTPNAKIPKKITYSNVFGQWLCDLAEKDERLVAITPAMREGSDLVKFSQQFPKRYFDVGIAEQHAVTLAAGFACENKKPVVAIYSSFLQRAYDQLIHDVALQKLDVTFAIDRAGLVGGDGATHMGAYDLSYMRCLPHLIIMAPSDENECRQMLYTAYQHEGPAAVRYPRGTGPGIPTDQTMTAIPIGKAKLCRQGAKIAILAFGNTLQAALTTGEAIDATVVNMRFIKPLDKDCLKNIAATHGLIVTVEENVIQGGAGSAVSEFLQLEHFCNPLLQLGLPDHPINHASDKQQRNTCGLDAPQIQQAILKKQQALQVNETITTS
ncbi:MAG: 1-deoxy-D-xylulose-5-phosphate synthase [Coxiellaceae bacterium]|nr:1-deoxy-D-xylulose-5-phosphate synthase [Coxiellaceae bacterium]|tara:strand:+ start:3383 stop:5266 length:1884 start_codon:yes stop_codon:yes gene_type:complete